MLVGAWDSPVLSAGDGAAPAGAGVEERAPLSQLGAPARMPPSSFPLPGPAGGKPWSSTGAAGRQGFSWFPSWQWCPLGMDGAGGARRWPSPAHTSHQHEAGRKRVEGGGLG